MRRFVPRALLTTAAMMSAVACASANAGIELGEDTGGRFLVMVPALEGPSGPAVANELRALITATPTHAAIADASIQAQMAEYGVQALDPITARQLAQQVRAQFVSWGTVTEGGAGLQADVTITDTGTGDQIQIDDVSGATPTALAQEIFTRFQSSLEGVRLAAECNVQATAQSWSAALTACDQALAIIPASNAAMFGRATALRGLERHEEALETYERLLAADPAHQDALLGAGISASAAGESEDAAGFYNRYLEVNPGLPARTQVAATAAQNEDFLTALRVLEPGITEGQGNVEFQRLLFNVAYAAGATAMAEGDSATARQVFPRALTAFGAAFPNGEGADATVTRQVIGIYNMMGQSAQAIQLAQRATTQYASDAAVWFDYATALSSVNRWADAIAAYDRVIQINPDFEGAYLRRAQANLSAGQRQQALNDFRQAAQGAGRATVVGTLLSQGAGVLQSNPVEAAETLALAYELAEPGATRNNVAFYRGYALYAQADPLARAVAANSSNPNRAQAQQALNLFQQALPLLQESGNDQAGALISTVQQFIPFLEAVLARGG